MKEEKIPLMTQPVAQLREKVEQQTRFKKIFYGYDTKMVDEFIKGLNAEIITAKEGVEKQCESQREELAHKTEEALQLSNMLSTVQNAAKNVETELEQAKKREKEAAIKANRDEVLIQELKTALDSQETERLKSDFTACRREKDECIARIAVLHSENEQARKRLQTLAEENRMLAAALSAAREKLTLTCNGVDQHATGLKTLVAVRGAEISARVQELAEICADFTETSARLAQQVQQSLCRDN